MSPTTTCDAVLRCKSCAREGFFLTWATVRNPANRAPWDVAPKPAQHSITEDRLSTVGTEWAKTKESTVRTRRNPPQAERVRKPNKVTRLGPLGRGPTTRHTWCVRAVAQTQMSPASCRGADRLSGCLFPGIASAFAEAHAQLGLTPPVCRVVEGSCGPARGGCLHHPREGA